MSKNKVQNLIIRNIWKLKNYNNKFYITTIINVVMNRLV